MPRRSKFELLLQIFGMWLLVQSLLKFTGLIVTTLVVATVGLMAATLFGLRFRRPQMGRWYGHPAGKVWIDLVCRCFDQQPPLDATDQLTTPELQLRTPEDFAWCRQQLKSQIFGHDQAITAILRQLEQAVQLRGRSLGVANRPPLGVFTLVGGAGIGKRLLAERIGGMLFRGCPVTVLNLSEFADDHGAARLFGAAGQEGCLVKAVRRHPCHTLVLENFENASVQVVNLLQKVLLEGEMTTADGGGVVGFGNCLVFFTSTAGADGKPLSLLDREDLVERVVSTASCLPNLMSISAECLGLDPPDNETKAKVVAAIMADECRKYRVQLDYVEAEVLAEEIGHYSAAAGFEPVKMRVARLIRGPVHLAASQGLESLVLTQDLLTTPSLPSSQHLQGAV